MYLRDHMLASNPQESTWDQCGYNPGWSTVTVPEGEGGGAFPVEGLCLWISPSFISYQSTSSSSFGAKLQLIPFLLVWSLLSLCRAFITGLHLVMTLVLVVSHLLVEMHWFGCGLQGEKALRFLFIYCFWWFYLARILWRCLVTIWTQMPLN